MFLSQTVTDNRLEDVLQSASNPPFLVRSACQATCTTQSSIVSSPEKSPPQTPVAGLRLRNLNEFTIARKTLSLDTHIVVILSVEPKTPKP